MAIVRSLRIGVYLVIVVPLGVGCGGRRLGGDGVDGGDAAGSCGNGEERLTEDRCEVCTCDLDGRWECPPPAPECKPTCTLGQTLPVADHCGFCTCVGDRWQCEDQCECTYAPTDDGEASCCSSAGRWTCAGDPDGGADPEATGGDDGSAPAEPGTYGDPFAAAVAERCGPNVPSGGTSVVAGRLDAEALELTIQYNGGCADHRLGLCYDAAAQYSAVGYRIFQLWVAHDPAQDYCGDLVTQTLVFDLTTLRDDFLEIARFHGFSAAPPIILDVPYQADPVVYAF